MSGLNERFMGEGRSPLLNDVQGAEHACRVLASAIGFTFSLTFATQGILGTVTEYQRMMGSLRRSAFFTMP